MKARLKQIQGTTFAAMSDSNHWSVIDTAAKEDGADGGSSPMETVLSALGSCSAIDILLMLKKMRAEVADFEVNLEAERSEEHPRVFTKVHIEYLLRGDNIKDKDVERAIQLSIDKYCSVAGMVSQTAEITTSFKIED